MCLLWWTRGESNSRLRNANAPLYHLTTGPVIMLPKIVKRFLRWYDRYDDFNTILTAFLFSIQIVHLFWLATNIVLPRLLGVDVLNFSDFFNALVAAVDYTEIPALIAISLIYSRSFRKDNNRKDFLYIILLNLQWFHILWITDEIVLETFNPPGFFHNWNIGLAWVAIMVDYLELPIIVETLKRAFKIIGKS